MTTKKNFPSTTFFFFPFCALPPVILFIFDDRCSTSFLCFVFSPFPPRHSVVDDMPRMRCDSGSPKKHVLCWWCLIFLLVVLCVSGCSAEKYRCANFSLSVKISLCFSFALVLHVQSFNLCCLFGDYRWSAVVDSLVVFPRCCSLMFLLRPEHALSTLVPLILDLPPCPQPRRLCELKKFLLLLRCAFLLFFSSSFSLERIKKASIAGIFPCCCFCFSRYPKDVNTTEFRLLRKNQILLVL
jgi:O-antigen ligase